ncbi:MULTISPECIES: hypothetical protein [Halorubrum]|uniref:Uncharacterized protein n=1 Tax=Halorubrum hochstenium ATCC 700873 TaxID=1227481 RepID=M0FFM4_9EURY|nr:MULTISPECIES: hypothetical protein [Halorubrum]ELZ58017.1 hypothetical protein C467_05869 [Halorubrum hochstenium ATCC 700873]
MTDRDAGSHDGRVRDDTNPASRPTAPPALTAGAALFNEGNVSAARDVWETTAESADEESGEDERLLRGLAATAAATRLAVDGDPEAVESAETAVAALEGVSDPHGAALDPVRKWAERLAADPGDADASRTPRIRVGGDAPRFDGLSLAGARLAAPALAGAGEPGDPEALAAGADLAEAERGTGRTRFAELLLAYLRTPDARPQIAARLADHVEREERKRRDVDGLF